MEECILLPPKMESLIQVLFCSTKPESKFLNKQQQFPHCRNRDNLCWGKTGGSKNENLVQI